MAKPVQSYSQSIDNHFSSGTWYQDNFKYLSLEIARLHYYFDQYIARIQHQEHKIPRGQPIVELAEISAEMKHPPAINYLCQRFDLSVFERDILLLCVGREIHPNFPSLCAAAHQNNERRHLTFGLALQLLPHGNWHALNPYAPLRYWELLQLSSDESLTQARLQVDESILHYLLGEPYRDTQLDSIVVEESNDIVSSQLSTSHEKILQQIVSSLRVAIDSSETVIIQLFDGLSEERRTIAAQSCQVLGVQLQKMPIRYLPKSAIELKKLLQRWYRNFYLTSSILFVDCDHLYVSELDKQALIANFIRAVEVPVILSTRSRFPVLEKMSFSFKIPQLNHQEKIDVWEHYLGEHTLDLGDYIPNIAAQFNLSPNKIQTISFGSTGSSMLL